jgi:hypothetical protein
MVQENDIISDGRLRALDVADRADDVRPGHIAARVIVGIDGEDAGMVLLIRPVFVVKGDEVVWILRHENEVVRDGLGEMPVVRCPFQACVHGHYHTLAGSNEQAA